MTAYELSVVFCIFKGLQSQKFERKTRAHCKCLPLNAVINLFAYLLNELSCGFLAIYVPVFHVSSLTILVKIVGLTCTLS